MRDIRDAGGFLAAVGDQIRWKRARKPLLRELEGHIDDRREALIAGGTDYAAAEAQAVKEMGDPEEIGLALDRVHRPRPNWLLLGCTAALLLMGVLLMCSVGDRDTYLAPLLLYAGLGTAALMGGYFLDYTVIARIPPAVLFVLCGVCMVMPMLGNLWLSTTAQLCYILPVLFIPLVYRARSGEKKDIVLMICGAAACFIAAVFSHSWMSLCIYILVVCGGMIIYAVCKGWLGRYKRAVLLWVTIPPAAVFAWLCVISAQSLAARFMYGVLDPESDPMGFGWVPLRVRELISTSRLFGEGETSELLSSFIAPNDMCSVEVMLSVAAHKHGLVIFLLVAALAAVMGVAMIRGIRSQSCRLSALTILTVGLCFGVRTVAYFISNLGANLFYFEGLPLFSYCGKLMVLDMLVMGMLLSVFRTESIARDSDITLHRPAAE